MRRLALTLLILCPLLAAQSTPPSPPEFVARFLDFSPEQAAQFQQLVQRFGTTMQNIQQQAAAKGQELQMLASADPPDPAAVGKAFLEMQAIQKLGGKATDSYHQGFVSLLTPEQKEKVQAVAQLAQLLPAVQAFAALSLVAAPPSPGQ